MNRFIPHRCRGLTFIELMFSTVILGVGMIIIASVFPVAIGQQRQTLDEGSVASLERGAIRMLEAAVAVRSGTPVAPLPLPLTAQGVIDIPAPLNNTGSIVSFGNTAALWDHIKGDLVNAGDPRYAFSPLYMRLREGAPVAPPDPNDDSVTFFVTTLASKDTASFEGSSVADLEKLKPSNVKITYYFKDDSANPYDNASLVLDPEQDTIKIEADTGRPVPNTVLAAVTGGYVIRGENVKRGAINQPNALFPQNAIIKLGSQFEGSEELTNPNNTGTVRIFRIAPGFELNRADTGPVVNVIGYAIGADPFDGSKKANRAISCRGVTVKIADPG